MLNLQQKLDATLVNLPGTFGVAIKNLETGESAFINGYSQFQLASTFKIPILVTLFRDVEEGKLSLSDRIGISEESYVPGSGILQEIDHGLKVTIKDLATLMIILSDNVATDAILNLVSIESVSTYMKELGLNELYINQSCWDLITTSLGMDAKTYSAEAADTLRTTDFTPESFDTDSFVFHPNKRSNESSPVEMNRLLEMIAKKELLSEASSIGILEILYKQQHRNRIPHHLPYGTKVASKTGTIRDVVNDVGIVYLPDGKGAYTISVFSKNNVTMEEGEKTIARIAKIAYDHFTAV